MNLERAKYILNHYHQLMNTNENKAWRHWSSWYKTEYSDMTEEQKEKRTRLYLKNGWMSQDSEVLELLKDGIDLFRIRTAERIAKDHPEVLVYNNCPKCGKLARTPFAKQCRFCFHDWH